jgi:multidrug efflux pump subunit AcrA (membrane-fusion protein)
MLLDTVKVVISVSETEYTEISKGQEALLVLDAYPNMEFVGEVSLIAPTLDTRSRTADVEVKFSNQDGKIRPGMFGLIKLSLTPRELLLVNR